jgi:hypothetical protein
MPHTCHFAIPVGIGLVGGKLSFLSPPLDWLRSHRSLPNVRLSMQTSGRTATLVKRRLPGHPSSNDAPRHRQACSRWPSLGERAVYLEADWRWPISSSVIAPGTMRPPPQSASASGASGRPGPCLRQGQHPRRATLAGAPARGVDELPGGPGLAQPQLARLVMVLHRSRPGSRVPSARSSDGCCATRSATGSKPSSPGWA